ncbi:hypothetical protein TKK_0017082 [Trichogramma kaykai]
MSKDKEKFDPNITDDNPGDAGEIERRLLARLKEQDELIATLQAQLLSLSDTKPIAVTTQGPVTSTASSPTYTSSALTSANPPISQSTPIFTSATSHTNTFVSPAQNFSNSPSTGFNLKFNPTLNPLANPFAQGNPHTQPLAPQQGFVFGQPSALQQGFVFNQPLTPQHNERPPGLYRYRQVSVPDFWYHDPGSWFELLESEFLLLDIRNDDIKYNASLRALGTTVCKQITAFLQSIKNRTDRFEKMKTHVINKYSPTEHEKIDQLFRHCSLGNKKPSELLNEMQALGQGYVSDQTLMLMWYRLLPNDLAILLDEPIASSNASSLIKKADRLHERLKPKDLSHISAIEHKGNDTTVDLATAVANAVVAAIGKPTQTRNRSRERSSNSESRSKSNTRYAKKSKKRKKLALPDVCEASVPGISAVNSKRLFVRDSVSSLLLLIDTGAEVSVFPKEDADDFSLSSLTLHAANGSLIKTYGSSIRTLNFGLRRKMDWLFIRAEVPYPILGADALAHFDLLPDLKRRRLIDNTTGLSAKGCLAPATISGISLIDPGHPLASLLSKYSQVFNSQAATGTKVTKIFHRLPTKALPSDIPLQRLEEAQNDDEELALILSQPDFELKLQRLEWLVRDTRPIFIYCEVTDEIVRPYIPKSLRNEVIALCHNPAHPGPKSTNKLLRRKYVWFTMSKDIHLFVKNCIPCQQNKIARHNKLVPAKFPLPDHRFAHVHIDIVTLNESEGYSYVLTMIDRYSRWPEAVPLQDMNAHTVARAFVDTWVSRYGAPETITSDQGKQFEGSVFNELCKLLGTNRIHTTPFHPESNGVIERWHRDFKATLRCLKNTKGWTHILPLAMLGLRTRIRSDLDASPAEIVYGSTLRLPGEFFSDEDAEHDRRFFTSEFRSYMQSVKPVLAEHHQNTRPFVYKDLALCSHVFLRANPIKKALDPPYLGPFKVASRPSPSFYVIKLINKRGSEELKTVSTLRLKPAFGTVEDIDLLDNNVNLNLNDESIVCDYSEEVPHESDCDNNLANSLRCKENQENVTVIPSSKKNQTKTRSKNKRVSFADEHSCSALNKKTRTRK